jgi:hypothetical protein
MAKQKPIIQQIKDRKWKWIGRNLREFHKRQRGKFSIGTSRDDVREEDLKDMEKNSRKRGWESVKDLERSWSLGPKKVAYGDNFTFLTIHGVSKIALQWYSKCYCVASVTKTFTLKGVQTIHRSRFKETSQEP